jgi:hypothetical protein
LLTGSLLQELKWTFKGLFNIALKSDIIFSIAGICNFYYYGFFKRATKIEDLSANCLSLLNFVAKESVPNWLIFAYNSINAFELLYIALLVIFIQLMYKLSIWKTLLFIILTYGIGNYLYIVTVTFIYLNYLQ